MDSLIQTVTWATPSEHIYFLFDENGKIVYVGRTGCIQSRMGAHRRKGKQFARIVSYRIHHPHFHALEVALIHSLQPAMNKRHKGNPVTDSDRKYLDAFIKKADWLFDKT